MKRISKLLFVLSVLVIAASMPTVFVSAAAHLQDAQPPAAAPAFDLALISQLLQSLLLATLPVLAGIATRWINAKYNVEKAKLSNERRYALELAARMAVLATEQLYTDGAKKKANALKTVNKWIETNGFSVDAVIVEAAIEAAVKEQFNSGTVTPTLTSVFNSGTVTPTLTSVG